MTVPQHLFRNGRETVQSFELSDLLYRGFSLDEYDAAADSLRVECVWSPDFSCDWSRYSEPTDIKFRKNGKDTDGCYAFSVEIAHYEKLAKAVHDPIDDAEYPNFAHVEVRATRTTDDESTIPPKGRKISSTAKKLAYRQNIVNKLEIQFLPSA